MYTLPKKKKKEKEKRRRKKTPEKKIHENQSPEPNGADATL